MRKIHARARLAVVIASGTIAACGTLGLPFGARDPAASAQNRPTADAEAARGYLGEIARLQSGPPTQQAETLAAARSAAENAPSTLNRLRYALLLAVPGHPGSDPVAARRQLSDLLARPELLLPTERELASLLLADVSERLVLIADGRRLRDEASNQDKERTAALTRRLQVEQEETARLRRALDEAQKKLNAVTQLERSISGRGNPPKP